MRRIGFIIKHTNGDWPFTESVANKAWKHSIELLSRHYDVDTYLADSFQIDSRSRDYRRFIDNIELLWFLQPYFFVDRVNDVPAVIYSLGSIQKGGYWLYFNRKSFRQSDSLVVNCSCCMSIYESIVPRNRLPTYTIPFGVDGAVFYPRDRVEMRRRHRIPLDRFVLVYAGRLSPEKNLDALLRVLKALLRSNYNVHMVIVGGLDNYHVRDTVKYPDMESALSEQTADLDLLSRVQFLGHRSQPADVAEIMSAADVGVNLTTAIGENFGYAQVEFQACGIPVVCSDYGGLKDTVHHGVTGFRVPTVFTSRGVSVDEKRAEEYIARLIDDRTTLERMSAEALVNARKYTLEVFRSSLVEVVEDTLERDGGEREALSSNFHPVVEAFYEQIDRQQGESHFADLRSLPFPGFYSGLGNKVSRLIRQNCVTTAANAN